MKNILFRFYLKLKYGSKLRLGRNIVFFGIPDITLGEKSYIELGENCIVKKRCDLRAYDNSSILIGSDCKLDDGVRVIAANGNEVNLSDCVKLGFYSVLNGGGGIQIGAGTSTYGFVYLQSSSHRINTKKEFEKEGYEHKSIRIGEGCLVMPHCSILPGSIIPDNTIVTLNSKIKST